MNTDKLLMDLDLYDTITNNYMDNKGKADEFHSHKLYLDEITRRIKYDRQKETLK